MYYDTRFELNIKGNKRNMIDARGMTTEYQTGLHDPKVGEEGEEEQLWSLIDNPDSGKTWMLPDVANKPKFKWDSRAYRQRLEYDIAQRPLEKWVQAPNITTEVLKQQSAYVETAAVPRTKNLLGQAYEQHDQAGKQSFKAYDFKGNLKTEARQFAQVFDAVLDYSGNVPLNAEIYTNSYDYGALNRPTSKTTPDNSNCKYSYAKNAMLESQTVAVRGSGNEQQAINNITYNAKGQRTDIYYANGNKTKYVYDPKNFRIIRILTTRNNGQEILQDLNYTFDAAGNITQMKDDAQQTIYFNNQVVAPICKYTYDALYRLKQATGRELNGLVQPSESDCPIQTPVPDTETNACRNYTLNYDYDGLGNILQMQHLAQNGNWTRNYFYPSNSNKLIGHTSGQTEYTYDAAGNMLSMPHINEMGWDEDDMLVKADLGGGGTAYYRYDSSGNRVRKVIVNGSVKKERLYINDFELWQQSTSGTVQTERETLSIRDDEKTFLQLETLTIDSGSTVSSPSINWRYQYDNHLGSACLELNDSANVISYEEYYPFGSTSYRSGKSSTEVSLKRYRYCGKERDEETGLYYYGARFYAAWIGKFISIDPLAEKFPQLTPYNYAGNKPITYKDLHGLQSSGGDVEVKMTDSSDTNWYQELKNAGSGIWGTVKNEVVGTYDFLRSDAWKPETWKNLGNLTLGTLVLGSTSGTSGGVPNVGALYATDAKLGTNTVEVMSAFSESLNNFEKDLLHGNTEERASAITAIVLLFSPGKLDDLGRLTKLTKYSNVLQKAGKVLDFKIVDKAIDLGKNNSAGWYDFVITDSGELRLGSGHHKLANDGTDNLIGAGEVYIDKKGKINAVNNNSGHYQPTKEQGIQAAQVLKEAGVTTDDVMFINYNYD